MRLTITKTGTASNYYVIRSVTREGKRSSEVVEHLGTTESIRREHGCSDAEAWARAYVEELNRLEKDRVHKALVAFDKSARIAADRQNSFNVGYLFLSKIYHELGIHSICKGIKKRHGFKYDIDSILSRLVYGRILCPSSKLSCFEQSETLLEQPNFELHEIYRALGGLSEESDFIQSQLYKNSTKAVGRSTGVLYYDCTRKSSVFKIDIGSPNNIWTDTVNSYMYSRVFSKQLAANGTCRVTVKFTISGSGGVNDIITLTDTKTY